MKKIYFILFLLLSACSPAMPTVTPERAAAWAENTARPTVTIIPTVTPTPTVDALAWARVTMVFANATDTQVAIAKTEQSIANAQGTQAAEAQIAAGVQTGQASQTQAAQTAIATQTQGARTQIAAQVYAAQTATAKVEGTKMFATQLNIVFMSLVMIVLTCLFVAWVAAKVWGTWKNAQAEYLQRATLSHDGHGRKPSVPEDAIPGRNKVMLDLNLQHRVRSTDDLTTEQALMNTHDQRELEGVRAIAEARMRTRPAVGNSAANGTPVSVVPPSGLLTDGGGLTPPNWNILSNWDGRGVPYGVGTRGLLTMDPSQFPHTGVFGQTRSGKSRYFLRTFIAGALAAGHRVVIIGKEGDFWPFSDHPNAKMIAIRNVTEESEARRYAGYLRQFVNEMNRRDEYLTTHRVSTWERAGRENTFLVLDELGNTMQFMPRDLAVDAFRWIGGLANEGGKNGFGLVVSSQRSVGFRALVSQMGRAVFRVDRALESQNIIGMTGAEMLQPRHFLSLYGNVNHCVAFDPSDQELMTFLNSRPAKQLEPMDWIDGEVRDVGGEDLVRAESQLLVTDEQIADLLRAGMSQSATEKQVFGYAGGAAHARVKAVFDGMQIPTTTLNVGTTSPVAA